jgi:integrase/recombinase XerC/integrase/recombinase XerD
MYFLGARASEIGTLRRDDIKDSTGEVVLRRLKGSWFTTIRLDKPRQKVLRARLNERPGGNPADPLFPSQKAGKDGELQGIKRSAIYRLTASYGAAAGIAPDKCHPHIFKHSIAVHMAESGLGIKEVQDFL